MRNFSVVGVGHTGITVSNLEKSLHFYRDVLGFQASEQFHAGGATVEQFVGVQGAEIDIVFVRAPGHLIELLCYRKPDDKRISRLRPCDTGCLHLCLKVVSIDKVVEAMRGSDFEPIGVIQTNHDGPAAGLRAVYTRDPDGVHIELIEDRPGVIFEELFFGTTGRAAET